VAQYLVVAALGGLVGTGELIARYRDDPFGSLRSWYAAVYVGFNMIASVVALALTHVFGWTFGATTPERIRWTQALVAGFGAMAFFRTSLFVVRAGNQDIGVGPASFLQIILFVADRGVDRTAAQARSQDIPLILDGLEWDQVKTALPPLCIGLMQNLSADEQDAIGRQVIQLDGEDDMPDRVRVLSLGLVLATYVGEDVLMGAVEVLRAELGLAPRPELQTRRVGRIRARIARLGRRHPPVGESVVGQAEGARSSEPEQSLPPIPPGGGTEPLGS
jgi:hypothetical protein